MSHGSQQDEQEIRCKFCQFLLGFGSSSTEFTCIYCVSEREFFKEAFNGQEAGQFVYQTIQTDKSHYRRGLMHDRKNAIRTWLEILDVLTDEDCKDAT